MSGCTCKKPIERAPCAGMAPEHFEAQLARDALAADAARAECPLHKGAPLHTARNTRDSGTEPLTP